MGENIGETMRRSCSLRAIGKKEENKNIHPFKTRSFNRFCVTLLCVLDSCILLPEVLVLDFQKLKNIYIGNMYICV